MTDDTAAHAAGGQHRRARRNGAAPGLCGPRALTGTHCPHGYPEGRIPAVPGSRRATPDPVVPPAEAGEGPFPDGPSLDGSSSADHPVRPFPPHGTTPPVGAGAGGRRLKAALATVT